MGPGKAYSFRSQVIQVGGFDCLVPVAAQIAGAMIVGYYQHDIGSPGNFRCTAFLSFKRTGGKYQDH